MFDLYFLFFPYKSSLTQMPILDIKEVYLMSSFGQQPLVMSFKVVFIPFGSTTSLEWIKIIAEVYIFFFDSVEIGTEMFTFQFIVFEGGKDFFKIDIHINQTNYLFVLEQIVEVIKFFIQP